jgi:hypothetical protein
VGEPIEWADILQDELSLLFRNASIALGEKPSPITFEERGQEVLSESAIYFNYYPER